MSLGIETIRRFENLTNGNVRNDIHNLLDKLITEYRYDGFANDTILTYLEEELFQQFLCEVEMDMVEKDEEEKRKALKVANMLEIEKLAKEAGIKVKFEL